MGAVDLVVQVESPPTVASGLQRVGRAGHQVGAVSRGVLFPKFRGDLVQCALVAERMKSGAIESIRYLRNPLDVLAQQIVAMVSERPRTVDDVAAVMRRSAAFASLPDSALHAVLDMLAGRYPSDAFAELRPRLTWDRVTDTLTARAGAQRLAVTSGGTIPDRGLFGVFLVGGEGTGGRRVGELDEEMVYESRVGDVFLLGSSSWRIEDITHDRVLVTPAPGQPGKMPFWHGDAPGPAAGAGPGAGRLPPRGRLRDAGGRSGAGPRRRARRVGRGQPAGLPRRAEGGDRPPPRRPHAARRAVPRRAGRLAAGGPLAVRRAGQRPVVAGPGRPAARALRRRRRLDALRRRHRAAAARHHRRAARGRPRRPRPGRRRARGDRRGRQLGAVRQPVPGVRRPGAAAPPPRPAPAHPAVAAAPARRPAAVGGQRVRLLPDHARGGPRGAAGRLRRARPGRADARRPRAPGPRGRRADRHRLTVRPVAAVRLRRPVPLRGRRAAGRAARAGARPRHRPARRAARPHGAARAARRRGDGRDRGRAAAAARPSGIRGTSTAPPTCCAWSAT